MTKTAAYDSLVRHFETARETRSGTEPGWLERMRIDAMQSFESLGLPTPRHEDWRFTNLARLAEVELIEATAAPEVSTEWVESTRKAVGAEHRLVFANGLFRPGLSALQELGAGVRVSSLREVLESKPQRLEGRLGSCADAKSSALAALNTALFADGVFVELPEGATVRETIHLVFVQTGGDEHIAAHPRVLIEAGAGSHATIVEHYIGETPGSGLTNPLTEILVARDARIDHVALQERRADIPARFQRECPLRVTPNEPSGGSCRGWCPWGSTRASLCWGSSSPGRS